MKLLIASVVLTFAPVWCAAQDKMSEAFRKGVAEEEAWRNPNGAIEQYKTVLAQYEESRKMAATALFRMAESYRRLGKNEDAQAAYIRLLQQFPEQTQLVGESRKHVPAAAMSANQTVAQAQERAVLEQQITIARQNLEATRARYNLGAATLHELTSAEMKIGDAEMAFAESVGALPKIREVLQKKIEFAKNDLSYAQKQVELGADDISAVERAKLRVLEAERDLAVFNARAPKK